MKITLTTTVLALLFLSGCMFFKSYHYTVMLHNQSNNEIRVDSFQITKKKRHGTVAFGHVMPDGRASYGTFYWKPFDSVTLHWHDMETQMEYTRDIQILLPEQFGKFNDYPKTIIFEVLKNHSVRVLYQIWNPKKEDYVTIG